MVPRYSNFLWYPYTRQVTSFKLPPNGFSLLSPPAISLYFTPKDVNHYALVQIFHSFFQTFGENRGWVMKVLYCMMDTKKRFYPRVYENDDGKKLVACTINK